MFALTLGIVIGIILPMQTAVNSRLRGFVVSPYVASMISFTVGATFLGVMTPASHQSLGVSLQVFHQEPWWIWLGGFLGVMGLTANILLFPHIGGVQTAIMPILGQMIMGMLIDNFGWFSSDKQVFGLSRGIGFILVLLGIFAAVALPEILARRQNKLTSAEQSGNPWPWRLMGVVAGMLSASQTAVNGRLGEVLDSSVHASFISFFVGALTLIVVVGLVEHRYGAVKLALGHGKPWWIWIGGVLGGTFVLGNVYLVPLLGTGQTVVLALLGQIMGSLLVDQFGLLGAKRNPVVPVQVMGLVILIVGVGLIRLF